MSWTRVVSICAATLLFAGSATQALEITSPGPGLIKLDFTRGPNFGGNGSSNDCDTSGFACERLAISSAPMSGGYEFIQAVDADVTSLAVSGFNPISVTLFSDVQFDDWTEGLLMGGSGAGYLRVSWQYNPILPMGPPVPPGELIALMTNNLMAPSDGMTVWYDGAKEFVLSGDSPPLPTSMGATPITSINFAGDTTNTSSVSGPFRIKMMTIRLIPEPSTALLMGTGILGLALAGRSRKRN